MLPVSTTAALPLTFDLERDEFSKKIKASNNKIGWLHFNTDEPGGKFIVAIKDGLGRTMFKQDFATHVDVGGMLINLPVKIGEELEVAIEEPVGFKKMNIFLN